LADLHETDWHAYLTDWLAPFLDHLRHPSQKHWAPVYLQGLLGPGERKSIEPIADRLAPGAFQQLHHFVSASSWRPEPLEVELVRKAQELVGGPDAVLAIDDTALVKQGRESVGVAHQYCGQLGKPANCQVLVSLTLARREVPVCIGLRLFLPEAWADDTDRRLRAGVPLPVAFQPKWRLALEEIDRVRAAGAVFGCVAADAEYGKAAAFRAGLTERGLRYAVGIPPTQKVYPADVTLEPAPLGPTGRRPKHPVPSVEARSVAAMVDALPALRVVALRHQGPAAGALRRRAGARGRRPAAARSPASAGLDGVAGLRAAHRGRAPILPDQPPRGHAAGDPGRRYQGPLGLRTGAPADEGGTRPRSPGVSQLDGPAPPRGSDHDRPVLPPARAAWGKKGAPTALPPGRPHNQPCPKCAARSQESCSEP
jgi:hypothetical protein